MCRRTSVSGRATNRVNSSRLTSSTGTSSRGSLPTRDRDVETGAVVFDVDGGDEGIVGDPRSLDEPEHVAHGLPVEDDGPRQAAQFREDLNVGTGSAGRRHHHLDHSPAVVGRGVDDDRCRRRPSTGPANGGPGWRAPRRSGAPRRSDGARRRSPRPPSRRTPSRGPHCAGPASRPGRSRARASRWPAGRERRGARPAVRWPVRPGPRPTSRRPGWRPRP